MGIQVGEDCSTAVQALTHMDTDRAAETCHVLRMLSHSHACQSTNAPARVMRSQLGSKQAGSIIYASGTASGAAHAAQTTRNKDLQRCVATARPRCSHSQRRKKQLSSNESPAGIKAQTNPRHEMT